MPLVRSRTGEGNSLTLVRGDEETVFEIGERYLLPEAGDPEGLQAIEAELLFVGYGIHEPEHGWDDYDGLEVESRVVVFLLGAPRRDGEPVLPGELHAGYAHTMRGSVRKAAACLSARGAFPGSSMMAFTGKSTAEPSSDVSGISSPFSENAFVPSAKSA